MALTGTAGAIGGLFSGRPRHPVGPDGRMVLSDHLRELRARLLKATLAILVALVVSLFFFDQILSILSGPYETAQRAVGEDVTTPTSNGVGGPFMLYLKLCGLAAVVVTSPYWLYQLWAFILPGLHAHERTWTRVFAVVAGPLFIAGVSVGYYTLPKGLEILIGFTPDGLINLVDFGDYLSFLTRTLLVFGIAFEIPVFIILLNLAGVLRGKAIGKHRPWIVLITFVFAAVATPSTDPFTMLFLAVPMVLLIFVSEVIARWLDKRRGVLELEELDDDEMSAL